jgi:hypothetical protein
VIPLARLRSTSLGLSPNELDVTHGFLEIQSAGKRRDGPLFILDKGHLAGEGKRRSLRGVPPYVPNLSDAPHV